MAGSRLSRSVVTGSSKMATFVGFSFILIFSSLEPKAINKLRL